MLKVLVSVLVVLLSLSTPAVAQDRATLGYGRLFSNDYLGDGRDRWRTGSYAISRISGPEWTGDLPTGLGEVLEYRFRTEIIAPVNLSVNSPDARRYVGALSFGVHSHFALGSAEASLGAGVVVTGEQTGIGRFQRWVHDKMDLPEPVVLDNQIGNGFHPMLLAEAGQTYSYGDSVKVRPFVEAQAGVESFVRIGGDVVVGNFGNGGLMLRDVVTGQRYVGVEGNNEPGFSLVLGADVAQIFSSVYLPSSGTVEASESRERLRAGLHWQGAKTSVFYGVTWLSKEFKTQPEEQMVGSLNVRMRF